MTSLNHITPCTPRVAVTAHFGPFVAPVAEEHSLFAAADRLLREMAPPLTVVDDVDGASGGVATMPMVQLPAALVDGSDAGGAEAGATPVLCRAALEVCTCTHDTISVTNWLQWETTRDLVVEEMCGGSEAAATTVDIHVEVVVLRYAAGTMTALRFEDLFVEVTSAEEEEEEEGKVDDDDDDDEKRYGAVVRAAGEEDTHHTAAAPPALLAPLTVFDQDGVRRGEVPLPVRDPTLSVAELAQLVKSVMGTPHHPRSVRMAYVVLPPHPLTPPCTGADSGGERVGRDGWMAGAGAVVARAKAAQPPVATPPPGLLPIAAARQVGELVQAVLLYGCRAVRLVAVESGAAEADGAQDRAPPLSAAYVERVQASLDSLHAARQRRGQAHTRRPPSPPGPQAPSPQQWQVPALSPASLPEEPAALPPPRPSAPPRSPALSEARQPSVGRGGGPQRSPATVRAAVRNGSAGSVTGAHGLVPRAPDEKAADGGGGLPVSGGTAGAPAKREVVVVRYEVDPTEVYIVGPVDDSLLAHLASAIYERCCQRHDGFTVSGACGDGAGGGRTGAGLAAARPQFERVGLPVAASEGEGRMAASGRSSPTTPDEATAAATRTSINGAARRGEAYVLRLHAYDFSEEEEDELSRCVAEAMQNLDGFSLSAVDG